MISILSFPFLLIKALKFFSETFSKNNKFTLDSNEKSHAMTRGLTYKKILKPLGGI